jgi:hypothetical protein
VQRIFAKRPDTCLPDGFTGLRELEVHDYTCEHVDFLPDSAGRQIEVLKLHCCKVGKFPENMSQLRELSVYLGDRAGQWWPTAQQEYLLPESSAKALEQIVLIMYVSEVRPLPPNMSKLRDLLWKVSGTVFSLPESSTPSLTRLRVEASAFDIRMSADAKLIDLDVRGCRGHVQQLLSELSPASLASIEHLDVHSTDMTRVPPNMKSLKTLNMASCNLSGGAYVLPESSCAALVSLYMQNTKWQAESPACLPPHMVSLEHLDVDDAEMSDDFLPESSATRLQTLRMKGVLVSHMPPMPQLRKVWVDDYVRFAEACPSMVRVYDDVNYEHIDGDSDSE